ncbi:MAG: DUF4838 domain-containing protein [Planctomycetaceae bacterium]|nr:DUF4838 domain-containing protein [Planctomycetaceae bacterium]
MPSLLHRITILRRLALMLVSLCCATDIRADFVLVKPGSEPAPIVLFADAPPRTRAAAVELAEIIEKICGQRPRLIDGEPRPLPERAIWVGMQPAVKTLFPQLDAEFRHPEETLIVIGDQHVVIAGRDRWDPMSSTAQTKAGLVAGTQREYGTVNAVYTFLQDQLGARWFWPGELGEDVVRREQIVLTPAEQRYHPQIRSRNGVFHYSSLGTKGYGRSHDWTLRQRLQLDSLDMTGGHAFGDWWDRYHKTHPEIFALQPDGTRSGFPNPHNAKLCMSNPLVGELWLQEVAAALEKDPNREVFNVSPNDGWASGHCTCEKCRAWDHPDGEPRSFNWSKRNEVHPALSDRDVTFANKMGELLKQKYPDRDYRVLMMSYGHSRPVPIKARPADNVIMSIVANFFGRTGLTDRGSTRGDTFRKQFEGWAKIVPSMMWRPNTGSPAGWQQGLPDLSVQQTIRDFKDVAAANCQGIFIDSVWEHWATHGPQYYVMGQLTWTPGVDADAVLADYYDRAFCTAAQPVREYFEALERARMKFTATDGESGVFSLTKLYTPKLLKESQARLDRAAQSVQPDSLPARRVAFVQVGLDYTRLTVENITLMAGYWKSKDAAVGTKVKENWSQIEQLIANNAPAINAGPVRSKTPRMAGLHPDSPAKKVKAARAIELDLK